MNRMFALTICAAMLHFIGCSPSSAPVVTPAPTQTAEKDEEGHSHGAGPHGGTLADWGGGAYHIEFTANHDAKEATVYLLGSDEKSPSPIKVDAIQLIIDDPMTEIELVAKPLEGESDGMSSRFVGTHETIGIVQEFSGNISGLIDGTPYTSDFKEESHGADHDQ